MNEVNQIENFIQLDNGANRQVLNSDKFATKVMKLKTPAVQSFIPGKSITMDSHALVANVGYFYIHKDARNIVSEHQLEKNGFNITDNKEGNKSTQRVVSKDGKSFSFAKQEGIWLAPAANFFSTFASAVNAIGTAAPPVASECASPS